MNIESSSSFVIRYITYKNDFTIQLIDSINNCKHFFFVLQLLWKPCLIKHALYSWRTYEHCISPGWDIFLSAVNKQITLTGFNCKFFWQIQFFFPLFCNTDFVSQNCIYKLHVIKSEIQIRKIVRFVIYKLEITLFDFFIQWQKFHRKYGQRPEKRNKYKLYIHIYIYIDHIFGNKMLYKTR